MPPEDDIYKNSAIILRTHKTIVQSCHTNQSEGPLLIQYNLESHGQRRSQWLQFKILLIQQANLSAIVRKQCKNNGCRLNKLKIMSEFFFFQTSAAELVATAPSCYSC